MPRKNSYKFQPGDVVSSGTLRHYDLIHAFVDAVHDAGGHVGREAWKFYQMSEDRIDTLDGVDLDIIEDVLSELAVQLEGYAPEGYYFGASEGDGSLFGFWDTPDWWEEE